MGEFMSQDEITKGEFDTELTRLFAEKNESLSGNEFTQQLFVRLNHEHHMRQLRSWCAVAIVLALAAMVAPLIVRLTAGLFSLTNYVSNLHGLDTFVMLGMVLVSVAMMYRAKRRI